MRRTIFTLSGATLLLVAGLLSGCGKLEINRDLLADPDDVSRHASIDLTPGSVLLVENADGSYYQCTVGVFAGKTPITRGPGVVAQVPKYLIVPKICAPDGQTVSFPYVSTDSEGQVSSVRIGTIDYRNRPGGTYWTAVEIDYGSLSATTVEPSTGLGELSHDPVSMGALLGGVSRLCWMSSEQIPLCGTVTEIGPDGKVCASTDAETHHHDIGAVMWAKRDAPELNAVVGPVMSVESSIVCAASIYDGLVAYDLALDI